MAITLKKENKSFDGFTKYFEHESKFTKTKMQFSVYMPNRQIDNCIIWLSGLTCSEDNFITKAGSQRYLSGTNTMIICPDTSPRGLDLPKEHEAYDFGSGAGFYLNATVDGYKNHYNMYDYISKELVDIIKNEFKAKKISISGHSMGGHGALILGLKEKSLFSSVSAFSPIVNPSISPWGRKAFKGYLGEDESTWLKYDATDLVKQSQTRNDFILIDQGLSDEFLKEELLTDNFIEVCESKEQKLKINFREGYDHSYFYIASFIEEHINFHLEALNK